MSPADITLNDLTRAWEHVQENGGCAGVDGVRIDQFAQHADRNLQQLLALFASPNYRPLPLLKIVVQKKPGSPQMRRLLVPPVRDRILQTAVSRHLSKSFEDEFLDSSFAYRHHRSVDRAIARIVQWRDRQYRFVVDADIASFFDRVSHSLLIHLLERQDDAKPLLPVLRQWIHACFWDGQRVCRLTRGIAQGSPLSPLLANFFLGGFDAQLEKSGDRLVRFADHSVILCRSQEAAAAALESTRKLLATSQLQLQPAKTCLTTFDEGFNFLGAHFQKDHV